ncbi:hypothetical protein [Methylomonas koyamae]|uniref:hypothetical protein n=1 Tax=Methylomonas koyamae TaxID=702114 RepID=UPI0011263604|nr:hypothetical protein [Methylomonas koyamae]TPQ24940.1 hypothetical protein C2U68_17340 [Methylomonas koyamae]
MASDKPTPAEQDFAWFTGQTGSVDENTKEWFLERVSIRTESGFTSMQARNLTYSEYLARESNNEKH